ncbi:Hypothetical protein (Fragment) [Durusdinium trenchii]|uniref:Uncharacterized protein n=1 Tax=Durusdinium trenchii TaxID=1381693 RepID=A0ABP0SSI1_9DINO
MGFFLVIVALLRPSVGQLRPFGLTPDGRPKRLRIHNACGSEPVWIAHLAGNGTGPDLQNVKIEPNAMWDFVTSTNLSSTRYWPKYRCDQHGNHCLIGESGGVGQECDQEGCAPPVDTKFEATFGDNAHLCDFATQKPGGAKAVRRRGERRCNTQEG